MAQLQFDLSRLDARLANNDCGGAFQQFVFELLESEFPHLHPYPARGKDGGIDHITDAPGKPRTVIECKYCGTDGFEEARQRWKDTGNNLARNLAPADKPAQSQYAPWYRKDEPIAHYVFTTSARLENTARCDALRDLIRDFFHKLAVDLPHLSHLSSLVVEVRDWTYIELRIPPVLRFRWFVGERPNGMRLLASEDAAAQGFRAWLRSSKLPFYSRANHLCIEPAPLNEDLPDEKKLLDILEADAGTLGLILVGRGGVGKTRLALEVGHAAVDKGWSVWVVHRRLKAEALDQLAARLDKGSRVFLIFDYVETHPEFANIVQQLADIVDDTGHHIRYVATCRSSYYNAIKGVDRKHVISLSMAKPATEEWLVSYRRATVRHILSHANIPLDERNIAACHDLPVLAAFLHWLHYGGRTDELESLLGEEAFGKWVINRVELSFPGRNLDHSLARLVALFPIPAVGRSALTDDERELFYRLQQDGWIEKADDPSAGEAAWQTAHDVMADQVALHWLGANGSATYEWCEELLREAIRLRSLPSALRSLQRLAEHLSIREDEWEKLLVREAQRASESWRELGPALLRTSLLSAAARVRLLANLDSVFSGAEVDADFHNALGDVLRQLVETNTASVLKEDEREVLFNWVRRATPYQRSLQYLRAWAVRCAPEVFSEETLKFLIARADKLTTQYVLCAWIYAGLPTDSIEVPLRTWCQSHSNKQWFSFVAEAWIDGKGDPLVIQQFFNPWFARFLNTIQPSFIFKAWLDAGYAKEVVQGAIRGWLEIHKLQFDAQFVYQAWLDSNGDKELVREPIREWLEIHKGEIQARFVYKSWLSSRGEKEMVREPICEWLKEHKTEIQAEFVYRSWLTFGGDKELVREAIHEWLGQHMSKVDARFVYQPWLDSGGDKELVRESIIEWLKEHKSHIDAQFVFQPWLDSGGDKELVREPIREWLKEHEADIQAEFVYKSWLDSGGEKELVRESIRKWLEEHKTQIAAQFIYQPWLDSGGDKELVREPIRKWLGEHKIEIQADFVYRSWLDSGGNKEMVREAIRDWLGEHKTRVEAQFVYKSWLDSGGEKELVRESIHIWILEHKIHVDAQFVYTSWLSSGGDKELVRDPMLEWLAENGTSLDSSYVLAAWLISKLPLESVDGFIRGWLSKHAKSFEQGSYVLRSWLRASGDSVFGLPFVLEWLSIHGEHLDAQYVLAAWLKAKNNPGSLKNEVSRWLLYHGNMLEASHVIGPWLDAGGDYEVVDEAVIQWVNKYSVEFEACFVLAACLRIDAARNAFERPTMDWLRRHSTARQAVLIFMVWMEVGLNVVKIGSFFRGWLRVHAADRGSSRVICAWIDAGGSLWDVRGGMLKWLAARHPGENTSWVLVSWLRAGGGSDVVANYVCSYLANGDNPRSISALRYAWSKASNHPRPPSPPSGG